MQTRNIRNIVWDWNGTLLNDIEICIGCMNILLKERSLPRLSHGYYQEVFGFPIKNYFRNLGFDFSREPYEVPANRFVELYNLKYPEAELFRDALPTLLEFKAEGYRQFILSAQEQELLNRLLRHYGITGFFEAATGISDNYAHSKVDAGKQMMETLRLDPEETIMIGDTIHDFEVAGSLGVNCLLISRGHQSPSRLRSTGAPVLEGLSEISGHLNNHQTKKANR